jgi:hypothetical protein
MVRPEVTAIFLLAAPAAAAQGLSELTIEIGRAVELPAHQTLMEMIGEEATELAEFTTDGCSGGISTVWIYIAANFPAFAEVHSNAPPWQDCCIVHDSAYHNAGGAIDAEASFDARLSSDEDLRTCVEETAKFRGKELAKVYNTDEKTVIETYDAIAGAMYHSVRIGGGPCSGLPWRWGYGYPQCPTIFE